MRDNKSNTTNLHDALKTISEKPSSDDKIKKIMDKPKEEWVRIEDSHEPVISKREFDLVQRLLGMDTRISPNEEEVYVLSGLVVCAECGAPMIKRNVPAGGKVYSYYIC